MTAHELARRWVDANAVRAGGLAAIPLPAPWLQEAVAAAVEAYMVFHVALAYGEQLTRDEAFALSAVLLPPVPPERSASSYTEHLSWLPAGLGSPEAARGGRALRAGLAALEHFEARHPARAASSLDPVTLGAWLKEALGRGKR